MTRYDITLDRADVDTIAGDSIVSVTAEHGLIFEVTSEDGWAATTDPGVHRFALSPDQIDRLRFGRTVVVLPIRLDGSVPFTVAATAVTR
jgi:hypothetical protein